jgi:redox-sensitive bicupin YhaK (pirin superfamily)
MIDVRKSFDRGHFDHGWLNTYHTFSFADYHDPRQMGFRSLRVINEDRVQPGRGFGTHGHRDMEILSYVLEGALGHRDSMGTGSIIRPGDVQRMSAGTGVMHSEMNASDSEPVHFLQIWIIPERRGITPGYEQKTFTPAERDGRLRLVASRDARDGALTVHQDVDVYTANLRGGESVSHDFREGRYGWLQVARGEIKLSGAAGFSPPSEDAAEGGGATQRPSSSDALLLTAGDGAAISGERSVTLSGDGEVLLFDLP